MLLVTFCFKKRQNPLNPLHCIDFLSRAHSLTPVWMRNFWGMAWLGLLLLWVWTLTLGSTGVSISAFWGPRAEQRKKGKACGRKRVAGRELLMSRGTICSSFQLKNSSDGLKRSEIFPFQKTKLCFYAYYFDLSLHTCPYLPNMKTDILNTAVLYNQSHYSCCPTPVALDTMVKFLTTGKPLYSSLLP